MSFSYFRQVLFAKRSPFREKDSFSLYSHTLNIVRIRIASNRSSFIGNQIDNYSPGAETGGGGELVPSSRVFSSQIQPSNSNT